MTTLNKTDDSLEASINEAAIDAENNKPAPLAREEREALITRFRFLLEQEKAVLVAHYYVDDELQELADATGGCVADSLEMARFGFSHKASTIIVAGVRFMGETAKILSPEKRILVVSQEAECSLDLGCPAKDFGDFCDQYPDHTVVVYANTSTEVKARADWVVTSSIALDVVKHLKDQGKKILWAPDRYLGDYIQRMTGAEMLLWQGRCIVHEAFKATALESLKRQHPEAGILVHPESPAAIIEMADVVGSTSQLIAAVSKLNNPEFIVATESGIFHKMREAAPEKRFMPAPTAGEGATCISCAVCPWMKLNGLAGVVHALESSEGEVHIDEHVRQLAQVSIHRMIEFGRSHPKKSHPS